MEKDGDGGINETEVKDSTEESHNSRMIKTFSGQQNQLYLQG